MLNALFAREAPYLSYWLLLAVAVLDLVAITRALVRGHGVESTLAWSLGVLAFPGVGAVAYLLVANPSIRRARKRRRVHVERRRQAWSERADGYDPCDVPMLATASAVTGIRATTGNRVGLLIEDERAFEQIEAAIHAARQSVWAEYYIVRNDETGRRFLDLLTERARAGVDVRLLYDAVGSIGLDERRLQAIREAGGRVVPFLPVNPLRRRWAVHLRNHRKVVLVDGRVAFTGGMNVGDEYSGRARRRGAVHFRDAHLVLSGPAVADVAQVFADDWSFATREEPALPAPAPPGEGSVVGLVPSGPDQRVNASGLVYFAGIATARRSCWLTTPYFVPDGPTLRALVASAIRGVDVRVLLPARCDVALAGAAARSFYPELVAAGVRIFEYAPAMLHAKTLIADGRWSVVGSANVDMRSFRLNFELGVVLDDLSIASALVRRFEADVAESREITAADLAKLSALTRLGRGLARLASPIL